MLRVSTALACERYPGDSMNEGKEAIEFAILNSYFGGEFGKAVMADAMGKGLNRHIDGNICLN